MQRIGSALWPSLQCYQVYGASTNVGKTIVSTILCKAWREKEKLKVYYLKPVSTGPIDEADSRHITKFAHDVNTKTLFQFSRPVSPHVAARAEGNVPKDANILRQTYDYLAESASDGGVAVVETAGGVLSPAPSGSSQADVFRPLRLPVLLVGDYHLGGISSTVAAYEALRIRGYDVLLHLIFEEEEYQNVKYLGDYFSDRGVPSIGLPKPPKPIHDPEQDMESLWTYYSNITAWDMIYKVLERLRENHEDRIKNLEEMPSRAADSIWYPFTQHQGRGPKDIVAIDSAFDDSFDAYIMPSKPSEKGSPLLKPVLDGSASWWTQGLGHGNPTLSLSAAYAAGRYGHVMFAGAIHKPALTLAEMLLKNHENPRLSKVFYSDNGSTGMEVAVKMALRAARNRYKWNHEQENIEILGLKGSYHGDTIGVMDCAEPSTYNKRVEWYKPKGYWFDYPQIKMKSGKWVLESSDHNESFGSTQSFATLDEVFDLEKRDSSIYRQYIESKLTELRDSGRKFGALILEPVVLGAAGMIFVDPLFQNALIDVARSKPELISKGVTPPSKPESWSGLPIVFDEVFTGLYRVGRFNCSSFVQANPDIIVNAKLLTGGLIPLCTTTASEDIFNEFLSDDKADALLHGHSYTAHAIGCNVAVDSLNTMMKMDDHDDWKRYKKSWNTEATGKSSVWSMWSREFVTEVSKKESVHGAFALGSVFAVTLKDEAGGGYNSLAAQGLHSRLLEMGDKGWSVHSRVLGNVLYLICSQTSTPETLQSLEYLLLQSLD